VQRTRVVEALGPWIDPVIGDVVPGQPAVVAGIAPGDRILRVDTVPVRLWDDFVRAIQANPGHAVPVLVRRGSADVALTVTPKSVRLKDPVSGISRQVGQVGVNGQQPPLHRYSVPGAVRAGFVQAGRAGGLVLFTLKGLVLGQLSPRDIGGPILVVQISGQVARLGLEPFLSFLALFSMNLAILNLLPIPVLDGGHLLFLAIEGVRRKPLSEQVRHRWTQIGFAVLVAIMVLALANDVLRLIP
jgi:regulator of sigma E protease